MGEDDIVELLWKRGQVVPSSHTQRPSSDTPPILRGSGSGGGEANNAPLPQPPPPLHHQQSFFIQEDEMASWLYHPNRQDYFYSGVSSIPATHPPSLASLAPLPPPSAQYIMTAERPTGQILAARRAENSLNFSMLRGNIFTGGRVEARPSMQVGATPSSSSIESCVIPADEGTESRVSLTLAVPDLSRNEKVAIETVFEIDRTKGIQIQPATEIAEDMKRKEIEETTAEIQVSHSSELDAPPPLPQPSAPYGQIIAARRAENLMNFMRLRGNILSAGRIEHGPWTPVGSSSITSFSATESNLTPVTKSRATVTGEVSRTFAVPGRGRKENTVCEIAGTSSSGVETEAVQIQSEADIAEDREREESIAGIQGTEEARGSTSRKRSRAAEMHNLSERRRREKINEKMKALQELIPRCTKSDKASILDDVIEYVKWLQSQIQMIAMGHGTMPPMMYAGNMQQFMPHMAMGMMGMNQPPPFIPFTGTPFPRPPHIAGLAPPYPAPRYPFPNIQTSDPSIVRLPTPQPNVVTNQAQFPAYMNPYQFLGLHQMQQPPPPVQSQTTSQLSLSQASTSRELEEQDNQPTG